MCRHQAACSRPQPMAARTPGPCPGARLPRSELSCRAPPKLPPAPPPSSIGAESLVSGRRVKGRVAIACDAAGALDAAAVTGTLASRGRWLTPGAVMLPGSLPDHRIRALVARRGGRAGHPRPQPDPSAAGRGEAQRSRLDKGNSASLDLSASSARVSAHCVHLCSKGGRLDDWRSTPRRH
jgi:hypothetical protein